MKKSIYIAAIIAILVFAWFLSGYYFNNSDYTSDNTIKNNDEKVSNNLNEIIVESLISESKIIDQSIFLQGQTISYRSIDVKSETTGSVIKKYFKRGDLVNKGDTLIKISIEDRNELLSSLKKEFDRIKDEIILIKETKENNIINTNEQIKVNEEQIKVFQMEYDTAKN